MDPNYRFPGSPGTPLFQVSPERVNQQRYEPSASPSIGVSGHSRESSVHDKVAKFDSLASQSKALERKAADAALKRAMLGREEAESEMRRYREEVRILRKQVEEGSARERKVGERLETVMENYGRAKETHAHTQALWEKEIRRARKESFRSQSVVVKLQEELKAARHTIRASEANVEQEMERSKKREQEAFAARYQLVGVQEELANMAEMVKLVEQERDALKTIAKNEEIARIAAEGQIPLPPSRDDDEEFASPRKASQILPPVTVTSSASSEEEIEQLRIELAWERKRAERAHEHAQYMQLECQFRCCSCRHAEDKGERFEYTLGSSATMTAATESAEIKDENNRREILYGAPLWEPQSFLNLLENRMPQQNTVFIPAEGVFRIASPKLEESPWISPAKPSEKRSFVPSEYAITSSSQLTPRASMHSRTPSCEPPNTAIFHNANTSLLSLIDGSHDTSTSSEDTVIHHSTASCLEHTRTRSVPTVQPSHHSALPLQPQNPNQAQPQPQPHYQTFHTISTTTRIPLAAPAPVSITPPAVSSGKPEESLSPTMSREEALAKIRERRGRARSLALGLATPKKVSGEMGAAGLRDFSAPAFRSGGVRR